MKKGREDQGRAAVKRIHYFGRLGSRRTRFSKERLGGKGASLAYMRSLGLPVPPGLHHHHRGLRRVLRPGSEASPGAHGPGGREPGEAGKGDGEGVRR